MNAMHRLHVRLDDDDLDRLDELAAANSLSRSEAIRIIIRSAHEWAKAEISKHKRYLSRRQPSLPGVEP